MDVVETTVEIKMQGFSEATGKVYAWFEEPFKEEFKIFFSVTVFPVEVDRDWLAVLLDAKVRIAFSSSFKVGLSWFVSIIDVDGLSRFHRRFKSLPVGEHFGDWKYMKKSFILKKADEFLPEGVLTLRCNISFFIDMKRLRFIVEERQKENMEYELGKIFNSIPTCEAEREKYKVYDFSYKILTLPQFHECRKRFGVYGIPPKLSSLIPEPYENNTDDIEHVWIFDTVPDRYLMSLDEKVDSLGSRLLKASPVVNRCVKTPMREYHQKHINFPHFLSQTFSIVLYYLKFRELPLVIFSQLLIKNVYKFSHLYEIKELQQKCADKMVEKMDYEKLEILSDYYSDEYLAKNIAGITSI